jgi:hypothetical protein
MDPIANLTAKLLRYPHVRYTASTNSVVVEPEDDSGFAVHLWIDGDHYTVAFDGWHEEFPTADTALECFAFGLSTSCRLAVTYRGDMPTRWVVERSDEGKWVPDSETGLVLIPFWRPARIVHRQNRLIASAPEAADDARPRQLP